MDRQTSRHSFSCPDDHWEALDEIADAEGYDSRSAVIRDLLAEKVSQYRDDPTESHGHAPDDGKRRTIYLAAVEHSTKRLRVRDHHVTAIAEDTQINSDSVRAILHELRRRGYVSLMGVPPDAVAADPIFRVKPVPVDPDEWTYREEPRDSSVPEEHLMASDSTCLSHHFIEDSDACLKCGTPRSAVEDRERCDRCESEAFESDLDDGLCPRCRSQSPAPVGWGESA